MIARPNSGKTLTRHWFTTLALLCWTLSTISRTEAALLLGCRFDEDLCDEGEVCVADGLFGQCYTDAESETVRPLVLDGPLNELQKELMRLELTKLAGNGYNWPDAKSQCTLAYFKLAIAYGLDYDTDFCDVRNPKNIWELIQRIQTLLLTEEEEAENKLGELLAGAIAEEADREEREESANKEPGEESVIVPVVLLDAGTGGIDDSAAGDLELYNVVNPEALDNAESPILVEVEPQRADDNDKEKAESEPLTASEVGKKQESGASTNLELVEEVVPVISSGGDEEQQQMLKKDAEKFTNVDMGLSNTVHKIVKGDIQRVEGNRVYMKVAKENLTEEELLKVISFLDKKVADPNSLYFDEFLYEDGQLSFRISRIDLPESPSGKGKEKKSEMPLDNAGEVASAVYKRRKDIQTLAGVEVDETGIGSGLDVVPVERSKRDALFIPILAICALTITSLLSVLAVHIYRNRRAGHSKFNRSFLPEVIDQFEEKPSAVYEELCRRRMNTQEAPMCVKIGGQTSKHSSTSSWPDESLMESSSLDISTGHVLLDFLQQHLDKPGEISREWKSIENYVSKISGPSSAAGEECNRERNYDNSVVPYDESAVLLQSTSSEGGPHHYINASKIYDSDPQQVAYIATQSPLCNTAVDFWQMVWEQGVALIVNLANNTDYKKSEKLAKYWPEESSKVYGIYEVHLVSEHIWSEDYVIRSLYLKNLSTNETRTVTQFHYLSWTEGGVPTGIKSILEFRRKVNKSYRGRASPILVHCTNGAGRTGTFCLLDLVANRILKGVKELDIAASLEHLRDQRMGMVENEEQFKLVFSCVAEEVVSLLASLKS